jgi:hypothetical protein
MAIHHILDAPYRTEPFAHSSTLHERAESFVLRHDDLDFQNIFCDPHTGEVTCIIDWERCSTAPRCIGYSSLPIFLTMDWYPDDDITYSPWSLESYRNIYAKAMLQATGKDGDGRYTTKSALYQAAYAALYGSPAGGSISHFVRRSCGTCQDYIVLIKISSWIGWQKIGLFMENVYEIRSRNW